MFQSRNRVKAFTRNLILSSSFTIVSYLQENAEHMNEQKVFQGNSNCAGGIVDLATIVKSTLLVTTLFCMTNSDVRLRMLLKLKIRK